jgi:hypothetical protein
LVTGFTLGFPPPIPFIAQNPKLDGKPVRPVFAPRRQVSLGRQSRSLQQVGVPWFAENMVTPLLSGLTFPLLFAALYMSV